MISDLYSPTYDEIHIGSVNIAEKLRNVAPDIKHVCGISRGGVLPALIISHTLGVPLTTITYSSKSGKGDNKHHNNFLPFLREDSPIILIDDICDSGLTLKEISNFYTKLDYKIITCVLYYKVKCSPIITPDLFWRDIPDDDSWVKFPFEV